MTKKTEELQSSLPDVDTVAEIDPTLAKETEKPANDAPAIDPSMMEQLKKDLTTQIMKELASEQEKKIALVAEERKKAAAERAKYVAKMKQSKEPWVDIIGNVSDGNGIGIELDWNDAFIDFLRASGINGTDDDEVVQRYITLLLRDMADQMEEEQDGVSEFEG